jgi:uncharacterized protein (TIGR03435 family)
VHRATQTQQGFALIVGKEGPKLKLATPPPVTPAQPLTDEERRVQFEQKFTANSAADRKRTHERLQELQQGGEPLAGYNTQSWGSITSEDLAAYLVRSAEAPVVDQTGLGGKYNVTIETWPGGTPGGTIFDAVERLGLKLEARKVNVETVMVDQVSKTPTPD